LPFRRVTRWGPKDTRIDSREWCPSECQVAQDSLASGVRDDIVTVICADMLPIIAKRDKKMFYLCTKNTVVPNGILPLLILATYHAAATRMTERALEVTAVFLGMKETLAFKAPEGDNEVMRMVTHIREHMDEEFRGPHGVLPPAECQRIVQMRQDQVLSLMRRLQSGTPMFRAGEVRASYRVPASGLRSLLAGLRMSEFTLDEDDDADAASDGFDEPDDSYAAPDYFEDFLPEL